VIKWGTGDSFDFAMVMASYLLGYGYDAYVVYGRAPSWICLRDQTRTEYPIDLVPVYEGSSGGSTSTTTPAAVVVDVAEKKVFAAGE